MSDGKKGITIYVRNETFLQSFANDLTSVTIIAGPVLLNELTLQSSVLNFMLGILGFLGLLGWATSISDGRRIRGATVDEIVTKLRSKIRD